MGTAAFARVGLVACFLGGAIALPALAQVYKWVDEKGVTHYGSKPPQGRKAQVVEEKLATPPNPKSPSARPPDWKSEEADFQERRLKAERAEQVEAERKTGEERQRRACFEARDNLARMRASPRIYRLNEKGERVFYDDAEREASISRVEKLVAQRCA
ncbi:MAG: DUF4124 domain-containing protein [Burkholderiales bacterium]